MIKSINYIIILATTIILGCQGGVKKSNKKIPQIETVSSSHLGAWEMIYFQSISGADTTELISSDTPLAITLMTPSHFSYQWRNSSISGAGTYTYDGKIIHEEFKYIQDSSFVGAILSFNMEVRNDSLIFSGPIKAVSSSGENIINQIPQMLEIRKKSKLFVKSSSLISTVLLKTNHDNFLKFQIMLNSIFLYKCLYSELHRALPDGLVERYTL